MWSRAEQESAVRRGRKQEAGRLHARPTEMTQAGPTGLQSLGLDPERDSYLYVPESYRQEQPAPLVLLLHGAGGHARHGLSVLVDVAEAHGLMLLAPASRDSTWDVIAGEYGPDVATIDRALTAVFERYAVDPALLAIGGFSDGASYALSLGITNGHLFTHILAFSPGFTAPGTRRGAPSIFISHGTRDSVLPIESCSRRIVPQLERAGYDVSYHEFDGGHTVPSKIAREAVEWFIATPRHSPGRVTGGHER